MLYSDLIGPPVAATSGGGHVSFEVPEKDDQKGTGRLGAFLLGHRQAKRHARPKQKTSHCSERNCRYLFRGFETFPAFLSDLLVGVWPFSSRPSGILTVTVIGVHAVAGRTPAGKDGVYCIETTV